MLTLFNNVHQSNGVNVAVVRTVNLRLKRTESQKKGKMNTCELRKA